MLLPLLLLLLLWAAWTPPQLRCQSAGTFLRRLSRVLHQTGRQMMNPAAAVAVEVVRLQTLTSTQLQLPQPTACSRCL